MHQGDDVSRAHRFFERLLEHPRLVVASFVVMVAVLASAGLRLAKDTSTEAFLPAGHSSLEHRLALRSDFGVGDPIAVAVMAADGHSIYRPETLELVSEISEGLQWIEGIDPHRITSLATEDDIRGADGEIEVDAFLDAVPQTASDLETLRARVEAHRLLPGALVARDGSATLIVAEVLDGADIDRVYAGVRSMLSQMPRALGETVHVAGEGAITGTMSDYIDRDAARLNPVAALVITLILFLGFRSWRGVLIPQAVNLAALLGAIGLMAMSGTPFYLITNGLIVLLIGVAVADGIHLLDQFNLEQRRDPDADVRTLCARAMSVMWRPIAVTSLTDMGGFLALAAVAFMPPMAAFGWFAAVGVLAALLVSVVVVPCLIVVLGKPRQRAARSVDGPSAWLLRRVAGLVTHRPRMVLALTLLIAISGAFAAGRLSFDDESIDYFHPSEPIVRADRAINQAFDGTHVLELVIDSGVAEGVANASLLARVARLQDRLEALPGVRGTSSVVDLVEQVETALHPHGKLGSKLADPDGMVAQSLMLYSMGAGPEGFGGLLDGDLRQLIVRARLGSSRFSHMAPIVEAARDDLARNFGDLEHYVAGAVELDHAWIMTLRSTHFRSLGVALLAVWLTAALTFGSPRLGSLAMVPVTLAVLAVYAALAVAGRDLGVAMTMFAAIAIGTSVDFSVHLIDALRRKLARGAALVDAIPESFQTTGRSLVLSGSCLVFGFLTLSVSLVPSLRSFGLLVATGSAAALASSLLTLPSLVMVLGPSALGLRGRRTVPERAYRATADSQLRPTEVSS